MTTQPGPDGGQNHWSATATRWSGGGAVPLSDAEDHLRSEIAMPVGPACEVGRPSVVAGVDEAGDPPRGTATALAGALGDVVTEFDRKGVVGVSGHLLCAKAAA